MATIRVPFTIDDIDYITDPKAHIEVGDKFIAPSANFTHAVFECLSNDLLPQNVKEYYIQENMIYAKSTDVDYFFGTERKHCYKIINEL